jgi:adenine-specific DNA-methyltransferase
MKTAFLSGSRRISRLNDPMRRRLDQLMQRHFTILIGDANGADRAMQRYLAASGYESVIVFAVPPKPRNNEGAWQVEFVTPPTGARGFHKFSAKDRVMASRADAGLMLWDGESRGTLANLSDLLSRGKPIALYYAPNRAFVNLQSMSDLVSALPSLADRMASTKENVPADRLDLFVRERDASSA